MHPLRTAALAVFLCFSHIQTAPVIAGILTVPAEYPTIQSAIDNAHHGDTIIVNDGTYTGKGNRDLDFAGKNITLRSLNGPEKCVINCQKDGRGFYFHSDEPTTALLQGFTITNGWVDEETEPAAIGAGICCENASPTIRNCIIKNNTSTEDGGAGIYIEGASLTIDQCTIQNNVTQDECGAGICAYSSSLTITQSVITDNAAAYDGGGIYFQGNYDHEKLILIDTVVSNNKCLTEDGDTGGGIYYSGGTDFTLNNCTITGNSTPYEGGGIYCDETLTMNNCLVENNTTREGAGGAIWCWSANLTHCRIIGNTAKGAEGAGIYCEDTIHLEDSTINNNTGRPDLYGTYSLGGAGMTAWSATILRCEITNNTSWGGDGAGLSIYDQLTLTDSLIAQNKLLPDEDNFAGRGGGIHCTDAEITNCQILQNAIEGEGAFGSGISATELTITDCTVAQNTIKGAQGRAGGIGAGEITLTDTVVADNTIEGQNASAGGIGATGGTLSNLTLTGNQIGSHGKGAGIYADNILVQNCTITDNRAQNNSAGGGVYGRQSLVITDSVISRNALGAESAGAGVRFTSSDGKQAELAMANCILSGNQIDDQGNGGALAVDFAQASVINCTLVGNRCPDSGGAIYNTAGKLTLNNSILWQNTAAQGPQLALAATTYTSLDPQDQQTPPTQDTTIVIPNWLDPNNTVISDYYLVEIKPWPGARPKDPLIVPPDQDPCENPVYLEITLPAAATVSHCNIQGGLPAIHVDPDCQLDYHDSNIDQYPGFAQPGLWDGDQWIEGDYQLIAASPCVDAADTDATEDFQALVDPKQEQSYGIYLSPEAMADPDTAYYFEQATGEPLEDLTPGIHLLASEDEASFLAAALRTDPPVYEVIYHDVTEGALLEDLSNDIQGNARAANAGVDIGAFEYQDPPALPTETVPAQPIIVSKMTLKTTDNPNLGHFTLAGNFNPDPAASQTLDQCFQEADLVEITVGPLVQSIPTAQFRAKRKPGQYKYKVKTAGITLAKLDLAKGTFQLKAQNAYLASLTSPIDIEITFGNYRGAAQVAEQAVNGRGFATLQFLTSYADALRLTQVRVKHSTEPNNDSLTLCGRFALLDADINFYSQAVTIQWGEQAFTLPAGALWAQKLGRYECKNARTTNNAAVSAKFDLNKNTWKTTISKTTIAPQTPETQIRLTFGSFDQSVPAVLP